MKQARMARAIRLVHVVEDSDLVTKGCMDRRRMWLDFLCYFSICTIQVIFDCLVKACLARQNESVRELSQQELCLVSCLLCLPMRHQDTRDALPSLELTRFMSSNWFSFWIIYDELPCRAGAT